MHLMHIVGARPNFMKVAPVIHAFNDYPNVQQTLVHTGQHYDKNMSDVFFKQLGLPEPDINLNVGSASHAVQTAEIMIRFEALLIQNPVNYVLVYGDVNSTIATTLVCAKLGIPVAHVEAGLRSYDRRMPEEINRIVTDQLADILLTPSKDGNDNLSAEGIAPDKIHFVGNVMIDTLQRLLPQARQSNMHNLPEQYALVTLHRPSNVDTPSMLREIMATLSEISADISILFPAHPRTRKALIDNNIPLPSDDNFRLIDPVGYIDFLGLQCKARLVITDSGGIQEETTYLGIPCLTIRENTERPITLTIGTNILVGQDMAQLKTETYKILNGYGKQGTIPEFWDGKASERIAKIILEQSL